MADVFRQYQGDSLYLVAFAVSLALLWQKDQKSKQGNTGKKAAVALLLSVVFVFNEFAYRVVGTITDATSYYRFFWMLPILFVIAYQLTERFAGKNKMSVLLAAAAFAVCLAVGANLFFLNRANFNRPQNIYGLDPDVITIAEEMMSDWDSDPDNKENYNKNTEKKLPTAAFDMYLEYQVRTYEPRILWGISRKAYLYQAHNGYDYKKYVRQQHMIAAVNEGIKKDSRTLRRSLDKSGVDYLVIRTAFDMDSYLSEIAVLPIAQSENYTLYKVR